MAGFLWKPTQASMERKDPMQTVKKAIFVLRLKCLLILSVFTASCSSVGVESPRSNARVESLKVDTLYNLPRPKQQPVIAIYAGAFGDMTGQRKSNSEFALFSSAITAAPEAYLIRALKHAGRGEFFRVVERVGIDNITKERQIIRSTRKDFRENDKLGPLLFAGLLMQGGVVDYETNLKTGGVGARTLGIGASREFREDTVTVSLRTVSVLTGEILIEVLVTKRILSVGTSGDFFRFVEAGTQLVELESGVTENESSAIALREAIETAVYRTIMEGKERGFWVFQGDE